MEAAQSFLRFGRGLLDTMSIVYNKLDAKKRNIAFFGGGCILGEWRGREHYKVRDDQRTHCIEVTEYIGVDQEKVRWFETLWNTLASHVQKAAGYRSTELYKAAPLQPSPNTRSSRSVGEAGESDGGKRGYVQKVSASDTAELQRYPFSYLQIRRWHRAVSRQVWEETDLQREIDREMLKAGIIVRKSRYQVMVDDSISRIID